MRLTVVALGVGVATASVALAEPGLLREPSMAEAPVAKVEPSKGEPSSAAEPMPSSELVEQSRTKSSSPALVTERQPWPSWRVVEVVDPWRERTDTTVSAAPTSSASDDQVAADAPATHCWAPVLHEPTPRFSRASTSETTPSAHWARPVAEIVNPWRPRPAGWVPASEMIVDPWSDS